MTRVEVTPKGGDGHESAQSTATQARIFFELAVSASLIA